MTESKPPRGKTNFRIPYPRGILLWLMRLPIGLYRLHLGWLLGGRFLLLEHIGRKSGLVRETVIEVVDHDTQQGAYVVAAAWGMRSDWYRNISLEPRVHITVRSRRIAAAARTLRPEEAEAHLRAYARRNPRAFRGLGSMLVGEVSGDTEMLVQKFVEGIPFVEFMPLPDGSVGKGHG